MHGRADNGDEERLIHIARSDVSTTADPVDLQRRTNDPV